jgi:hypothetical protein
MIMSRLYKISLLNLLLFCLFLCVLARPCIAEAEIDVEFVSVNEEAEFNDVCSPYLKDRSEGVGYIALIIDDMGPSKHTPKFIAIKVIKMSLAFLPYGKWVKSQSDIAYKNGHEVMLHMPMQPISDKPIEEFMIVENDTTKQAAQKVENALKGIKHVKGVNNHMGSLVTSNGELISAVLDVVKKHELYFVDSKTTAKSVAEDIAYQKEMDAIGRHIFLDDKDDKQSPYHRLIEASKRAKSRGYAVVIGHPLQSTYQALQEYLSKEIKNIKFVHVSEMIKLRDCLQNFEDENKDFSSDFVLDDLVNTNYKLNDILADIK